MSLTADILFNNFSFPAPKIMKQTTQEKAARHPNRLRANYKKRKEALARYKAVMGDKWWGPRSLGEKLGVDRNVPNKVMVRWYALDLVERRKVGTGYEWRMK